MKKKLYLACKMAVQLRSRGESIFPAARQFGISQRVLIQALAEYEKMKEKKA